MTWTEAKNNDPAAYERLKQQHRDYYYRKKALKIEAKEREQQMKIKAAYQQGFEAGKASVNLRDIPTEKLYNEMLNRKHVYIQWIP